MKPLFIEFVPEVSNYLKELGLIVTQNSETEADIFRVNGSPINIGDYVVIFVDNFTVKSHIIRRRHFTLFWENWESDETITVMPSWHLTGKILEL